MVEETVSAAPAASTTPKKVKASKPKKPKTAPNHPKVSDMVNAAISNLKERGGSSLQAIKKYIAGNYKVDVEKLAPFIRKYLKSGVASGALVQTKGKGASGSFKLSSSAQKPKGEKKSQKTKATKKVTKSPKPKKSGEKKVAAAKPKKAKKTSKPKKPKAPKKEKKAKALKKPKSPKPKKAAKKAASKK